MAQGQNAAKRYGRDYWSRRYPGCAGWGREGKRLTHRYERQTSRREAYRAEMGRYDGDGEWNCWHCMDEESWNECTATAPSARRPLA